MFGGKPAGNPLKTWILPLMLGALIGCESSSLLSSDEDERSPPPANLTASASVSTSGSTGKLSPGELLRASVLGSGRGVDSVEIIDNEYSVDVMVPDADARAAIKSLHSDLVDHLETNHATWLSQFEDSIRSGDPVTVEKAMYKAGVKVANSVRDLPEIEHLIQEVDNDPGRLQEIQDSAIAHMDEDYTSAEMKEGIKLSIAALLSQNDLESGDFEDIGAEAGLTWAIGPAVVLWLYGATAHYVTIAVNIINVSFFYSAVEFACNNCDEAADDLDKFSPYMPSEVEDLIQDELVAQTTSSYEEDDGGGGCPPEGCPTLESELPSFLPGLDGVTGTNEKRSRVGIPLIPEYPESVLEPEEIDKRH